MNYKYEWDNENALITFKGAITYADIEAADEALFGDPRFDKMRFVIYDFLSVEKFTVSDHNIIVTAAIKKSASQWNKKLKMALVAQNKLVVNIIERFIELMENSNWEIGIFSSLEDAFEWV